MHLGAGVIILRNTFDVEPSLQYLTIFTQSGWWNYGDGSRGSVRDHRRRDDGQGGCGPSGYSPESWQDSHHQDSDEENCPGFIQGQGEMIIITN